MARNLVIGAHRSRKARPQEADGVAWLEQESTERDDMEKLLTSVVVIDAMKTLSATHREALYLTYFLSDTLQEASLIIGLPVGTMKSRVHYGQRALRAAWRNTRWRRRVRSRHCGRAPRPKKAA
ncbi:sigma factor-like helix-turn-helix DNA-binding protein [Streptomyces flaveolus]|uniref:sigma factor-like helix-turn-helix DNA-binding protein n=1 Tax=Streptomyces flaveolus TaxID=67297 RepID=UPI0033D0EA5F